MRFIKNISYFIFALVATIVASDLFMYHAKVKEVSSTDFYDDIGRGMPRNVNYVRFNEGFSFGSFNGNRHVGPEYSVVKPQNTLRIALIGDSFIEGFQVFDRHHLRYRLEADLKKRFEGVYDNVEVMNFGQSGYDLCNMYVCKEKFASDFVPDYYLLFVSSDDLYSINQDLLWPSLKLHNSTLNIVTDFSEREVWMYQKTKKLLQNSVFFSMVNRVRKLFKHRDRLLVKIFDKIYYWFEHESNVQSVNILEPIPEITHKVLSTLEKNTIIVNMGDGTITESVISTIRKMEVGYFDLTPTIDSLRSIDLDPNYWNVTNKMGHWNQLAHKEIGKSLAVELHSYHSGD